MNESATELRVAYTRGGKKLHAAEFAAGFASGPTLCGAWGWRHPRFMDPSVAVGLTLSFNQGCARCLKKLEER